MLRSVIQKSPKTYFLIAIVLMGLLHFSFKPGMDEQQMLTWSNRCLTEIYDPSGEAKIKKWDLIVNAESFLRLRKTFTNGKQEYYSLHLHRFNNLGYLGTTSGGTLQLRSIADDIIVQTYNDPKGDIDSMASQMDIPVKNMEPERLDSLQMVLNYFKNKGL